MLWACAGCLAFLGGIWGWRMFSASKANIERSTGVLKPLQALGELLDNGDEPDAGDVVRLAERPELRHPLHRLLSVHGKAELMPAEFLGPEAQAEAALAFVLIDRYEREGGCPPCALRGGCMLAQMTKRYILVCLNSLIRCRKIWPTLPSSDGLQRTGHPIPPFFLFLSTAPGWMLTTI